MVVTVRTGITALEALLYFTVPLCFRTNSNFFFLILGRDGRDGQNGKKQLFNNSVSLGSEEDHR